MSPPIDIIAIVTPRPGKVDRIIEVLNDLSDFVKANEPRTLRYHLYREINKKTGADELIFLESYVDMDAVKAHTATEAYKKLNRVVQEEDLVARPTQVKWLKAVGGFASRL